MILCMIEGKIETAPILDPHPRPPRRTRPAGCGAPAHKGRVGDADSVSARVAPRVRIDADEVQRADRYAGLFENFAAAGRFDRLTDIDEPAGKRVSRL